MHQNLLLQVLCRGWESFHVMVEKAAQ
jgi:hypothetical protein